MKNSICDLKLCRGKCYSKLYRGECNPKHSRGEYYSKLCLKAGLLGLVVIVFFLTTFMGVGRSPTPIEAKVISVKDAPIGTFIKLGETLFVKVNSEGLFVSTQSYSYPVCTTAPTITNTHPNWCTNDTTQTTTLTATVDPLRHPVCTWTPTTGLSDPTSCTTTATPTETTTYTVSIKGCPSPSSTTVTVNEAPSAVTVSTNGVCGTQTLTATGGANGTIYYQATTSGGTSTTAASSTASVSTSGTYYFRSQSSTGCWGEEGAVTVAVATCAPTTMQNMTADYCASMSNLDTLTLTDTRDNKTYRVRKFADGHCWMIDNLAYGDCTASSFTSSTTTGYCRNNPESTTYGHLYNWPMALTVCPSPWNLPPNAGDGSFYNLHTTYSSISGSSPNFWANSTYWNGVYSGLSNLIGMLYLQASLAYYWSRTQYNTGNGYNLLFNTDGSVSPQSYYNKGGGFSVRCVF